MDGTNSTLKLLSLNCQGELKKKIAIAVFYILVYLTLFVLEILLWPILRVLILSVKCRLILRI